MSEEATEAQQSGRVTLGHLLMLMGFACPAEAVILSLHQAGGNFLRYAIGVLVALVVGAAVVRLLWLFGRFLWLRSEHRSERMRNAIALGVYTLDFAWIVSGFLFGTKLASWLIGHIA